MPEARSAADRKRDVLRHLEHDADAWVATAQDGNPYLIPLSFHWDGEGLIFSTTKTSRTVRNLAEGATIRIGLGETRDVVMIDGTVTFLDAHLLTPEFGRAFAAQAGFDPIALGLDYAWFKLVPERIQAWREENELAGRDLMRNGQWLV